MADNLGLKLELEGEKAFKQSISNINAQFKVLGSEMKLVTSQFDKNDTSQEKLTAQNKVLTKQVETQKDKVEILRQALDNATESYGETDKRTLNWQTQLNNAEAALNSMERELEANNDALSKAQDEFKDAGNAADSMEDGLDDAADAADDMADEVQNAGNAADEVDDKFSSWDVALGNLVSNAIQNLIDKCAELAKEIVELGVETESSFAQLETIAGTENIDDLTESLTELSSETGISSSELAVTAYNAISAGTSAENAAEMVEAASKLATAGFTDTDSALSVLTTAINAYGLSAEEVTDISDSLVQVQNLGVTTIDELASSMGKAISTASAYNVDLSNLESAYVSLTKAGISTEESTTYLSSMLKELGDSSSDVASIIQTQTGKSFSELMDEGYSLGDVMSILYEACDGDSTALMNLWSSAEAGKASNAIVSQGLEEFNENLNAIENSSGSTEDAYSTMSDTMEHKLSVLTTSFENLGLELYDKIEPVLNDIVDFITDDVIPAIDVLIDNLPSIATLLAGVTAAIIANKVATLAATVAEEGMTIAQYALNLAMNLNPIGIIIVAIAALAAAIIALVKNWDTVSEALSNAWAAVTEFFTNFTSWISDIWNTIAEWFSSLISSVSEWLSGVWESISSWFTNLFSGIGEWFSSIWSSITAWFSKLSAKFKSFFTGIKSSLSSWLSNLIKKITSWFSSLWTKLKSGFSSLWTKIKNIFTGANGWTTKIKTIGKDLIKGLWNGINDKITWLKNKITNFCSSVIDWFKDLFDEHSPSKVAEGIGGNFTIGFGNGITEEIKVALNAAKSLAAGVLEVFTGLSSEVETSVPTEFTFDANSSITSALDTIDTRVSVADTSLFSQMVEIMDTYLPLLSDIASKDMSLSLDGKTIGKTAANYLNSVKYSKLISQGVK